MVLIQYDLCPYKKRRKGLGLGYTEERPCEDTEERQPSLNQRQTLQKKASLPTV